MSGVRRAARALSSGAIVALAAATTLVGAAHGGQTQQPPIVVAKKPARPNAPARQPGKSKAEEKREQRGYLVANEREYLEAKGLPVPSLFGVDSTLAGPGPLVPSSSRSWQGEDDARFTPMDSTGAVGPSRYVELVNSRFGIYDRTNDTPLAAGDLTTVLGAGNAVGDPQIIWDDATGRFYLLAIDFDTGFVHYAYSTTSSPSSSSDFCPYVIDFGYGSEFPDYPKMGDTQNFLLVGVNVFDQFENYDGSDALWIAKPPSGSSCAAAPAIGGTSFLRTASASFTFTPVGVNQTDSSTTGYLIANNAYAGNNQAVVFSATENGSGGVTIPQLGKTVAISSFAIPPNAPQAGTSSVLDTLDGRFTQAVSGIDPTRASAVGVWTQHTVSGGGGAQVRWYEINPATPTVLQSGSVSGTSFVFNGAISPDRVVNGATKAFGGSMVLGFNTSSTTSLPAIQMVAKPAGSAQSGFVSVKTSTGVQECFGLCRWGDYSAATPDPAADTTAATGRVWLTNEWSSGVDRTWNWAAGANKPGITSFTPTTGPVGTLVTLNGTAFTGATSVKFGSVAAVFTVVSDGKITATVPPLAPPLSTISVTTPLGTFVSATTFKVTPAITSLSPLSGEIGDAVTITGSSFTGATSVKFGAVADSTFVVDDDSQITAHVPPGAVTAKITVTTPGGVATSAVSFGVRPTISSFTPTSGPSGTVVTISGNTLTGVTKIAFGAPTATGAITPVSNTVIKATVPASAVTGPITVTNAGGSTVSAGTFTVLPKITSFSPASGVAGTSVTINGTGLGGATDVKFNGVSTPLIVSNTATSVVAKVPDSATKGTISVTTPSGTAVSVSQFSPTPKLTLVAPSPAQAGDALTISGTNLSGATVLKLGATLLSFTVDNPLQLSATLPLSAVTGSLTVTTPAGTSAGLTLPVRPTISSFTPLSGPSGTVVTITGNTFTGVTKIAFGAPTATGAITPVSNTQIKATVPASAVTGPITVTNAGGSTVSAGTFTVLPKITAFSPASGVAGTNVTINGTGLGGATDVTFNGVSAAIVSTSATKVVATVPSNATSGPIAVTTPAGTAASRASFTPTPKLTLVAPNPAQVGDTITISGSNLTGATSLKLGAAVVSFSVDSAIQLTATVPPSGLTGNLVVTTPGGTSPGLKLNVRPTISSFAPTSGQTGTTVTITGVALTGTTAVNFGGAVANAGIVSVTNTEVKVTVNGNALTGPITVTNAGGSTASVGSFAVLPKITGFNPSSGPTGTLVTINGSGLAGTTDVQFNGTSSTSVTVVSPQQLKATVPVGATTGTIHVVTPSGSATSNGTFTVTLSLVGPLSESSYLGLPDERRRRRPRTARR